jgi:hypothetical protein
MNGGRTTAITLASHELIIYYYANIIIIGYRSGAINRVAISGPDLKTVTTWSSEVKQDFTY